MATCQASTTTAAAASFGSTAQTTRRRENARVPRANSRASRPASREACSLSATPMLLDLLSELLRDLLRQHADLWRLDPAGPGNVDPPGLRHLAGARAEQHDPVAETGGLTHVVGDEDDRYPG